MFTGRYRRLSLARRIVCDFVHAWAGVPLVPIERRMQLGPLLGLRERATPRPSWVVLFFKALARVSEQYPELRRHYVRYPWPRLYESDVVHGAVAIERIIE